MPSFKKSLNAYLNKVLHLNKHNDVFGWEQKSYSLYRQSVWMFKKYLGDTMVILICRLFSIKVRPEKNDAHVASTPDSTVALKACASASSIIFFWPDFRIFYLKEK